MPGLVPPLNADLRIIEKACRIITKSVSGSSSVIILVSVSKAFSKRSYLYLKVEGLKHTHHLFLLHK